VENRKINSALKANLIYDNIFIKLPIFNKNITLSFQISNLYIRPKKKKL
jgi:hypothetical protein